MQNIMKFNLRAKEGTVLHKTVNIKQLCLARNCNRDIVSERRNLDKKRAEGYLVHGNPSICRKSRYLLTNEDSIEVQGPDTSGEVEIVAIIDNGEVLISVGSDHNDRSLINLWTKSLGKIFDTAKSKQMCPAVIAKDAWNYEDVVNHWDTLKLKSYVTVSGKRVPFQNFALSDLVRLEHHFQSNSWLRGDGVVLFGGTSDVLPTFPHNLRPSDFHFEVYDPILDRTISHSYEIRCLEKTDSLASV